MANNFQINLLDSYQAWSLALNQDIFVDDHWLNDDGTVTVKTWFARLIYWIRDLFYDKTSRDIYAVFQRCVDELNRTIADYRGLRHISPDQFRESLNPLQQRVEVVNAFLLASGRQIPWYAQTEYQDFIGSIPHLLGFLDPQNFASEEQAAIPSHLNEKGLKVGPVGIELHLPILPDDEEHSPEDLLPIFDGAFPLETRTEEESTCHLNLQTKLLPVTRLVPPVTEADIAFLGWSGMDLPPAAFFDQMNHLLKNIVAILKSPDVDVKKRQEVLCRIGHAVAECPARWIGETVKQYKLLTSQGDTLCSRVLLWVQTLKEDILYQDLNDKTRVLNQAMVAANGGAPLMSQTRPGVVIEIQDMAIHCLNYCRLSDEGVLYKLDPSLAVLDPAVAGSMFYIFRGLFELLSLSQLRSWFFPSNYVRDLLLFNLTPERAIQAVAAQMESERESWPLHGQETHDFLLNVVRSVGIEKAEDYVAEHYYDAEAHINAQGISRILRELAIY